MVSVFFQYKYFFSKKLTAKNDETALRELREPFMHDFSTQWSTNGKLVVWVGGLGFESGFPPQLHSLSYGDPIGIQTSYPPKPTSGETPKKVQTSTQQPHPVRGRELCTSITRPISKIPKSAQLAKPTPG